MTADATIQLAAVLVTRTSEALAEQLRELILGGSISPGSLLPNERELGEQTGLSRGSVREALRILEAQGLVVTRLGRNGGRIAQRLGVTKISQSLEHFVRGQQVEFTALLETAEALEPALAALAALHRTTEDIEELERATQELHDADGDAKRFLAANTAWHLAIATASHNPMLIAMMQSVGSLLHDPHVDNFTSPAIRAEVRLAHDRVQAAVIAGEPDAARRRMERHVMAYRARVASVAPKIVLLR